MGNLKPELYAVRSFSDDRGDLSVVDVSEDLPFEIKRIYYLHNVPSIETRGSHAHKELWQFIIAMSGSFSFTLDSGTETFKFDLVDREHGVLVPPGHWRELSNFSNDAVCMVIASMSYSEDDYIRDYSEFSNWVAERKKQ